MDLGLTENQTYNNSVSVDMKVYEFANPDRLKADDEIIGFNPEDYIKKNNNDDDYPTLDDNPDNYETKEHSTTKESAKKSEYHSYTSHTAQSPQYQEQPKSQKVNEEDDNEENWTEEELLFRKVDIMRKLGELREAGVTLTQNYNMNSSYKAMKIEYELHSNIRAKRNTISWMSNMMIGVVKGLEMLNDNVNPFDMKFDGMWSNEIQSDIKNYYDVLGEIYEKYSTPGKKMAPELKLFLMMTSSAVGIQMHKGIASYMGNKSNVAGDLDADPDMFAALRKKKEDQRKNMDEKMENDYKAARERMEQINLLKKQKKDHDDIQMNMNNYQKMNSLQNDLVLSESAKSLGSKVNRSKYNTIPVKDNSENLEKMINKASEQITLQQKKNAMKTENKTLAEMHDLVAQRKKAKNKVMAKPVSVSNSSNSSNSSKSSKSSKCAPSYQQESTNNSTSKIKSQSDASSVISHASIERPSGLGKIINNTFKHESEEDVSSVKQLGIVEKNMVNKPYNLGDVSFSTSNKSKSKGKPKKVTIS